MERKDSWTDQDDSAIAEVVLKHIRKGSTQTAAFLEASERLGRSSSACGFRWNSMVRKNYEEELTQAKADRKNTQDSPKNSHRTVNTTLVITSSPSTPETPIETLKGIAQQLTEVFNGMQEEIEKLRIENVELKKRLEDKSGKEDLNSIMTILENARKLGFLDKQRSPAS